MDYDIEALLRERAGYLSRGQTDRAAQVARVLKEMGVGIEDAVNEPEETAVKRGPGRPRKN